jgi:hypothetical protein
VFFNWISFISIPHSIVFFATSVSILDSSSSRQIKASNLVVALLQSKLAAWDMAGISNAANKNAMAL